MGILSKIQSIIDNTLSWVWNFMTKINVLCAEKPDNMIIKSFTRPQGPDPIFPFTWVGGGKASQTVFDPNMVTAEQLLHYMTDQAGSLTADQMKLIPVGIFLAAITAANMNTINKDELGKISVDQAKALFITDTAADARVSVLTQQQKYILAQNNLLNFVQVSSCTITISNQDISELLPGSTLNGQANVTYSYIPQGSNYTFSMITINKNSKILLTKAQALSIPAANVLINNAKPSNDLVLNAPDLIIVVQDSKTFKNKMVMGLKTSDGTYVTGANSVIGLSWTMSSSIIINALISNINVTNGSGATNTLNNTRFSFTSVLCVGTINTLIFKDVPFPAPIRLRLFGASAEGSS